MYAFIHKILRWMVAKLVKLTVYINEKSSNMASIHRMLSLISMLFYRHFKQFHSAGASQFLSFHFCGVKNAAFHRRYILSILMTHYIRQFLARRNWQHVSHFLDRNCSVVKKESGSKAKFLLCTHTGDYWISILMAAREYTGMNCRFIVPIYDNINEKNQQMYNDIAIPGVEIIFICIHNEGALKKIVRYMKDPDSIVAIFYDLYCYSAGIYNGSAEPVSLFERNAHMTTGILQIAQKMRLSTSFVSCYYAEENQRFYTEITPPVTLSPGDNTRQEMIVYLENKLRARPWQWNFISVLDTYFHYPFTALQAMHARQQAHYVKLLAKYQGRRV